MATVSAKLPIFMPIVKYDDDGAVYGGGIILGKMMNVSVAETYTACTAAADRKQLFDYATVTLGTTNLSSEAYEKCFGSATVNGDVIDDGEVAGVSGGFAYITGEVNDGVHKWCVHLIKRVVFTPPSLSAITNGKSVTYTTPSIVGIADSDGSGSWRQRRYFTTAADAVNYLKAKAGIIV